MNDFIFCAASEAELASIIDGVTGVTNKLQQKSRLRQAWTALGKAAMDAESLKRKRTDDADLDLPLDKPSLDSLQDSFHLRYHMTFFPSFGPIRSAYFQAGSRNGHQAVVFERRLEGQVTGSPSPV